MRSESIADRRTALAAALISAACGGIGCGASDPAPAVSAPQLFATRAWPALGRCAGCHASQPAIDFLAPGTPTEAYATLFAFQPPIVDVASPASSLVLTMGQHTGPALLPSEAAAVLAWLEAERAERVPDPGTPVTFGPVDLALNAVNVVDLGRGATLQFVPSPSTEGVALRGIELTAGAAALHVVHPLFASQPSLGPPRIDTTDAFGDVDLDLAAGTGVALGGGAAVFPGFDPGDPITIHFRTLEAP
jgi:hypothetical protein